MPGGGVGEGHAHCHQCAGAVGGKGSLDVVVRGPVRQVHAFDVNQALERLHDERLASEGEAVAVGIAPGEVNLVATGGGGFADGHCPAIRAEHPLADQGRVSVGAVDGFV